MSAISNHFARPFGRLPKPSRAVRVVLPPPNQKTPVKHPQQPQNPRRPPNRTPISPQRSSAVVSCWLRDQKSVTGQPEDDFPSIARLLHRPKAVLFVLEVFFSLADKASTVCEPFLQSCLMIYKGDRELSAGWWFQRLIGVLRLPPAAAALSRVSLHLGLLRK